MESLYHWVGVGVFWAIAALSVWFTAGFAQQWVVRNKVRFWAFQIVERIKGGKNIEKWQVSPDVSNWALKHYYRMFSDKSYKHYRKGWQIYRKYWTAKFSKLLEQNSKARHA